MQLQSLLLKFDLNGLLENLAGSFGDKLPGLLGALVILIVGWFIASAVRKLVAGLLKKTDLDNKLMGGSKSGISTESFIAKLVYYLIMMTVLLVVLEKLGITDVLDPLKDMMGQFLGFIPNLVGAGIIGFVGYIIATIASEVVGYAGSSLDSLSNKMGMSDTMNLPKLLRQVVFIIVFMPLAIAAIDRLGITAISEPAKEMLSTFMSAIPNILVAAIIIGIFYVGGKFLKGMGADLLKSLGIDKMAGNLGLSSMTGNMSLSKLIPNVAFFFLMLTGITAGVSKLGFAPITDTLDQILGLTGGIAFGLIILAIGGWLSQTVHGMMSKKPGNEFMASLARVAVLAIFIPMALDSMNIAGNIVNLAFGLILGAVAVAFALSFGLGGREAAGKHMEHILAKFRK